MEPQSPPAAPPALLSSPCLRGERVAFTGTLASMTHRQAQDLVAEHGGTASAQVGRSVTLLVVGEEGWPLEPDGGVSKKLEAATDLVARGVPLRIVAESDWLQLLGLEERRREMSRLHTPAMLSQVLQVPVGTIRRWHALGFIRPVKKVWRLPYFDFREVSAARKVLDLMRSGVSAERLRGAFDRLARVLGREQFPQARLDLIAQNARLLYRDETGLVEPATGQRVFDFSRLDGADSATTADTATDGGGVDGGDDATGSPSVIAFPGAADGARGNGSSRDGAASMADPRDRWTASDWQREGLALLDTGDAASAIEALRLSLMDRPDDPETHFALAEALYRTGHVPAALERYHCAVEHDHDYVEAWVQLGCVQAELDRPDQAEDAFRVALRVHPDYADAHWQLAETLHRAGRTAAATPHWRRYLEFNERGPWADQARQRLAAPSDGVME